MLCAADRLAQRNKCMSYKPKKQLNVLELPDFVRTGDLLLFSSRHAASNVTKCFTASVWDHVAIVVAPSPGFCFVVEWAGGIFVSPLKERLTDYFEAQGRLIAVRRLWTPAEAVRQDLESFIERAMASGLGEAPPHVPEIIRAVLRQWGWGWGRKGAQKRSLVGQAEAARFSQGELRTDMHALFCSKFVASIYKNAGLIRKERGSAEFLPKHFSSSYNIFLNLQLGSLGEEIAVSFEPHVPTPSPTPEPRSSAQRAGAAAYASAAAASAAAAAPLRQGAKQLAARSVKQQAARQKRAAVVISAAYRGMGARREYTRRRQLREAARRPGALAVCLRCLLPPPPPPEPSDEAERQLARAQRFHHAATHRRVPLAGSLAGLASLEENDLSTSADAAALFRSGSTDEDALDAIWSRYRNELAFELAQPATVSTLTIRIK